MALTFALAAALGAAAFRVARDFGRLLGAAFFLGELLGLAAFFAFAELALAFAFLPRHGLPTSGISTSEGVGSGAWSGSGA
jgi:hypothetical protein